MRLPFLQEIIHQFEVGWGTRFVRYGLSVMAVLLLVLGYDFRAYRNMSSSEAMDAAQVARNVSEGKGFTTLFVRPFSMFLVKRHNQAKGGPAVPTKQADLARIQGMHPDLQNPPVYPLLLAGLMKVLPFRYPVDLTHSFWSVQRGLARNRTFWRYEPDFLIALFNQLLLFAVIGVTFLLARKLFDLAVAWLSALLLLFSELLWRFSASGLPTILMMLIFLGLVWTLVWLEEEGREPKHPPLKTQLMAGFCGLLLVVGALTRYSFAWLLVPVVGFLILFGGKERVRSILVVALVFAVGLLPWVLRNYAISGTPFGTAGYSIFETTFLFPENRLGRALEPNVDFFMIAFWHKLMSNLPLILQNELPRFGGTWVSAFFLVGLMISFTRPAVKRLRYFLLVSLVVFIFVEAFGRTEISEESPQINTENLLVLLMPLVVVYGVSLFQILLDQMELPILQLRYIVIGLFVIVASLPMLFIFFTSQPPPLVYPPYYPPQVQTLAKWVNPDELIMSDIPWAVAWYGDRQSVWITLNARRDPRDPSLHEDFFAIHDYQKTISALYLTPVTLDKRFLSQWFQAGATSWGTFALQTVVLKELPPLFPLKSSPTMWPSDQILLMDWERWLK